jgi:hypothetical protein
VFWDPDLLDSKIPCVPPYSAVRAPKTLPVPLGADDLDALDELLRNNGDCDHAAEFAAHVKAIMRAYAGLYYVGHTGQ